MRIGIDARAIFSRRPRGTGRNLFDAYRLLPSMRPDWQFLLYHQRDANTCPLLHDHSDVAPTSPRTFPNVHARRIDIPGDRFDLWFQFRMPLALRRDAVDLAHFPANAAPAWCPVPFVVTVHDLIPLTIDERGPARYRRAFHRGLQRALRRAAHIITPSEATRTELDDRFGVSPDRITVVPWAPDHSVTARLGDERMPEEVRRVRARYRLGMNWLLNFSGSSRRKNATGIVDAVTHLSSELRSDVQILLVGCEPAAHRAALEDRAERRGIRSCCRFVGFVPHEDLAALLHGARGLLMPSLAEGFGLPILDAFASGVPVLTSNLSSMPEVAGDAALLCNPHDPRSIAEGITQLLDPSVANRLVGRAFTRVPSFTWERTAAAMCAVYERCLSAVHPSDISPVLPPSQPAAAPMNITGRNGR